MRDAWVVAGVLLVGLAVVGAAVYQLWMTPRPTTALLAEQVTFPDYSTGQPGLNSSDQVWFHVTIATVQPWAQGQEQHPEVTVVAEPGPGVADVNLTTFFLDLGRAGVRGYQVGDLDLMEPVGPNRWVPEQGPMRIWPNADTVGSDLYLTFQMSLSVAYVNGSSYGYGGWNPQPRLPITIAPDPLPAAFLLLVAGAVPGTLLVAAGWSRNHGDAFGIRRSAR